MFDPYFKWLGIAPKDQPPHHYRLLGIDPFISDPDVIENAADRQMMLVRTFQTGDRGALSQRILNEIAAAKVCLLNPASKAAYDGELRSKLNAPEVKLAGPLQAPSRPSPPVAPSVHRPVPTVTSTAPTVPTQPRPTPVSPPPSQHVPPPKREQAAIPMPVAVPPLRPPRPTRPRAKAKRTVWIVAAVAGVIAGVTLFALLKIGSFFTETGNSTPVASSDADPPNKADGSSVNPLVAPPLTETIDWVTHGPYPWIITDGGNVIEVPDALRPNSWLLSSQTFADFSLTGEFKVEPQGEGGVYVRVPSNVEYPWSQGIEIHFKDDWGKPPSAEGTGAVWKMAAPVKNKARPSGQWNQIRIECQRRRVDVWINDELVIDYSIPLGFPDSGHIGLDGVHGGITYRNLRLVRSDAALNPSR